MGTSGLRNGETEIANRETFMRHIRTIFNAYETQMTLSLSLFPSFLSLLPLSLLPSIYEPGERIERTSWRRKNSLCASWLSRSRSYLSLSLSLSYTSHYHLIHTYMHIYIYSINEFWYARRANRAQRRQWIMARPRVSIIPSKRNIVTRASSA